MAQTGIHPHLSLHPPRLASKKVSPASPRPAPIKSVIFHPRPVPPRKKFSPPRFAPTFLYISTNETEAEDEKKKEFLLPAPPRPEKSFPRPNLIFIFHPCPGPPRQKWSPPRFGLWFLSISDFEDGYRRRGTQDRSNGPNSIHLFVYLIIWYYLQTKKCLDT